MAVDSGNSDAPDCFRLNAPESVDLNLQGRLKTEAQQNILERSDQNSSGKDGTSDIAITVSHPYNAVALLNRKGFKRVCACSDSRQSTDQIFA